MKNFRKKNILIAKFMGLKYYRKGVLIDNSDIGGIYSKVDVYSQVPIKTFVDGKDVYFSSFKNPDFGNLKSERWNSNIEFLDWDTLNFGKYQLDIKYYENLTLLFEILGAISNLGYDYTINKFGCVISKYSDLLKEDENIAISENPSVDIKINIFNAIYDFISYIDSLKTKKAT